MKETVKVIMHKSSKAFCNHCGRAILPCKPCVGGPSCTRRLPAICYRTLPTTAFAAALAHTNTHRHTHPDTPPSPQCTEAAESTPTLGPYIPCAAPRARNPARTGGGGLRRVVARPGDVTEMYCYSALTPRRLTTKPFSAHLDTSNCGNRDKTEKDQKVEKSKKIQKIEEKT